MSKNPHVIILDDDYFVNYRYEKSAAVCPSNGYPFHQMAITQLLITTAEEYTTMNNYLSSFYYFVRAMASANPHLHPYQAFDSLTHKIVK